jgi:hypothetical protein
MVLKHHIFLTVAKKLMLKILPKAAYMQNFDGFFLQKNGRFRKVTSDIGENY